MIGHLAIRGRTGWQGAFLACVACVLLVVTGCARDPHKVVIPPESKENFTSLVGDSKGLTPEETTLLVGAELRVRRTKTSEKVVGKTIADVIADQRIWQAERDALSQKLEPLYRAGKSIKGAISVGVTQAKYAELLQGLTTEFQVASDKVATDEERRVLALFSEALRAYRDAGLLWDGKIESSRFPALFNGDVELRTDRPELVRIVSTYRLSIRRDGEWKIVPFESSVRSIWRAADSALTTAVDAYVAK